MIDIRLIDADALKKQFCDPEEWADKTDATVSVRDVWKKINSAPTVKSKWMPIGKCPKRECTVLLTTVHGDERFMTLGHFHPFHGFACDSCCGVPIAWAEVPEPYEVDLDE